MDKRKVYKTPLSTKLLKDGNKLIGCITFWDEIERKWLHYHFPVDEKEYEQEMAFMEYKKLPGSKMWFDGRYRNISLALERIFVSSKQIATPVNSVLC